MAAAEGFAAVTGKGMTARVDEREVLVGNGALLSDRHIDGLQTPSGALAIMRLAGPEPLYSLRAAPEVRVIVRAEPGAPIQVVDIVRPAALRNFAHAIG